MRAPDFIQIKTGEWAPDEKPFNDLKVGDKVFLCFGKQRSRETAYEVTLVQDRGDKTHIKERVSVEGLELTRFKDTLSGSR